jgi:hypothetical protein
MYIDGSPILHIVDEATPFQAAQWLLNMTAQHVWETLRACWIDVYLGPPDLINHDAGTNFTSSEFQQYANPLGIATKEVPVMLPTQSESLSDITNHYAGYTPLSWMSSKEMTRVLHGIEP